MNNSVNNMNELQANSLSNQQQSINMNLNQNMQVAPANGGVLPAAAAAAVVGNQYGGNSMNYISELKSKQQSPPVNGTGGGQQYPAGNQYQPTMMAPSSSNNIQQQLQASGYVTQPGPHQSYNTLQQQQQQFQHQQQQSAPMQQQLPPVQQQQQQGAKDSSKAPAASRFRIIQTDKIPTSDGQQVILNGQQLVNGSGLPVNVAGQMPSQAAANMNFSAFVSPNPAQMNNYQRGRWHVVDIEYAGGSATAAQNHPEAADQQSYNPAGSFVQTQVPVNLVPLVTNTYNPPVLLEQSQVYGQSNGGSALQNHAVMVNSFSAPPKPANDVMHTPGASTVHLNGLVNTPASIPPSTSHNANMPQQQQQMQSTSAPNIDIMQQQPALINSTSSLASGNIASAASMVNSSYGSNLTGLVNSNVDAPDGQSYKSQAHPNIDQNNVNAQQMPPNQAASSSSFQASPKETTQQQQNVASNLNSASATAFDQTASSLKDIILNTGGSDNSDTMDSGIHSRINKAMDLVKSHLTSAVTEEIVHLKHQIKQLNEKCHRLEQENLLLKQHIPAETLSLIENRLMGALSSSSAASVVSVSSTNHLAPSLASATGSSNSNLVGMVSSSNLLANEPAAAAEQRNSSFPITDANSSHQQQVLSNPIAGGEQSSFVYNNNQGGTNNAAEKVVVMNGPMQTIPAPDGSV